MRAHHWGKLAVLGAVSLALLACNGIQELDPEQPCNEAGYAIASRVFDCLGDGDAANAAYEAFKDEYACIPVELNPVDKLANAWVQDSFHCAYAIRSASCTQVETFGDELEHYLHMSPSCSTVITHADGSPIVWEGFTDPSIPCTPPEVAAAPNVTITVSRLDRLDRMTAFIKTGDPCIEVPLDVINGSPFQVPQGSVITVRDEASLLIWWFIATTDATVVVP